MTNETSRNVLHFGQRAKIYEAIKACTEPDGDEHIKFTGGENDQTIATAFSKEFGFPVAKHVVKEMRQLSLGMLRHGQPGAPRVSRNSADIEGLRAAIASLTQKVENLREIIAHHDQNVHRRRQECGAKLRETIGKNRVDLRAVKTAMRGAGYSDEEIVTSLWLTAATIRQSSSGDTVEISR